MAYAVARPGGRWELREACTTSRGPRSRTLASFRVLTDDVVERARKAATIAVSAEDLREAARRAGVPAEMSAADTAARILLAEMAAGRSPSPSLRRLLAARVGRGGGRVREAAGGGAVEWLASTAQERGEALRDLLALTDRLPARSAHPLRFPSRRALARRGA